MALNKRNREGQYGLFNLTLRGHQLAYNNPGDGKGGVSVIKVNREIPFALGIQGARGVHIEDMVFDGFMSEELNKNALIEKPSNEIYPQSKYAPLAAIVIDPFSTTLPEGGGYKGMDSYYSMRPSSSRVHIEGSVIQNFPTGIAISPNGSSAQGDSVAITFTRFDNLLNGVVICQTQSRNVVVDNCSFHRMKYAFNADEFGAGTGILPEVNNIKIADAVAWVYRANGNVSYGHFRNVYAEGLYGIGYSVINKQPLNFEGCVFKFRPISDKNKNFTNPCILKADNASFTGCTFTIGGGKKNVEPIVMDVGKATFINCYLDSYPVNIGENLKAPNISEYINSNLRENKRETSTWNVSKQSSQNDITISFDASSGNHYFESQGGYKVGDFVFGKLPVQLAPFQGKQMYTVIGRVTRVTGNIVYLEGNNLKKKNKRLKVVRN